MLHGVNMVWKTAPYVPPASADGFVAADADWLADHGFNTARIGVLWVGVTPDAPDAIDHAFLEHWTPVNKLLHARPLWMLFGLNQDIPRDVKSDDAGSNASCMLTYGVGLSSK